MVKEFYILIIIAVLLSQVNIGLAQVAEAHPFEIDLPERHQITGRLAANGTYFELNNSEYLNITAVSSKPVKIMLGSVLERITIHIEPVYDDASTQMTLGGFVPETTYHMHEDDYHNVTTFTTDTKGTYTYVQDLSEPHFIFIRPVFIPKDIPTGTTVRVINDNETGGDCTCIGNWDPDTKTCTLTTDLTDTIQIDSDNITLDGDGHVLSGNGTGYGVVGYGEKNGLTIRNLEIKNFSSGIYFGDFVGSGGIKNSTITHNTIINSGIYFYMYNNNNTISYNIFNKGGIHFRERNNYNTISHNILNGGSIYLSYFSNNNTISLNNISNNTGDDIGIWDYSSNNTIINNNINKPLINYGEGIVFWYRSNYNLVSGNNISNASIHQDMGGDWNTIINNTISGGSISCIMTGGSKIINNKIMNSPYSGIYCILSCGETIINNTISNSKYGISFRQETSSSTVINNNISNTEYGIFLSWEDGTNHKIINNNIANNDYGIYIQNAIDNLIYQNNLFDNTIHNAFEQLDTGSNQWDNGTIGNYWDDYKGNDANGDGIGDIPHPVPGGSSEDRYPLMSPCGDVDCNGIVNMLDVRLLMNNVSKAGYPVDPLAGDVDGDGDIDGDDVRLLVDHIFDKDACPLNCK